MGKAFKIHITLIYLICRDTCLNSSQVILNWFQDLVRQGALIQAKNYISGACYIPTAVGTSECGMTERRGGKYPDTTNWIPYKMAGWQKLNAIKTTVYPDHYREFEK